MPTSPAHTADEIVDSIRSLIDRVGDSKLSQDIAKRGHGTADLLGEAGAEVGDRAAEAWRETESIRNDASKRVARATSDAAKWSEHTWRKSLRPTLRDLWKRRTLAIGAAGAAVPAGREMVDSAAVRLGLREREERHWGAFFLGLIIGAAAGAIIALLTTPKRGSEMRHEIGTRADEMATRAKDAEWVPIFHAEEDEPTNGRPGAGAETAAAESVDPKPPKRRASPPTNAAGEGASARAADVTAEAINDSFDAAERKPKQ